MDNGHRRVIGTGLEWRTSLAASNSYKKLLFEGEEWLDHLGQLCLNALVQGVTYATAEFDGNCPAPDARQYKLLCRPGPAITEGIEVCPNFRKL